MTLATEISVMINCSEYNLARLRDCAQTAEHLEAGSLAESELRARAEAYAGLLKQSIESFERLFENSEFRTGWNLNKYGQTLLRRGNNADVKAAEAVFHEVSDRESEETGERWFANHNIGLCRALLGDKNGAVEAFRAALEIKEDDGSKFMLGVVERGALRGFGETFVAGARAVGVGSPLIDVNGMPRKCM